MAAAAAPADQQAAAQAAAQAAFDENERKLRVALATMEQSHAALAAGEEALQAAEAALQRAQDTLRLRRAQRDLLVRESDAKSSAVAELQEAGLVLMTALVPVFRTSDAIGHVGDPL